MSVTLNASTITMNSAVVQDASGSTPVYMARAWVYFSCWGGIVTIYNSKNISSIVARATAGTFTANFSTAMPSAGYAVNTIGGTNYGNGANEGFICIEETTGWYPTTFRSASSWPFVVVNNGALKYGASFGLVFFG